MISEHARYISILTHLVELRSPYTEPEHVEILKNYCKDFLTSNLTNYTIFEDEQKNIVAIPNNLNSEKELLYLSAHIDTVPAEETEWTPPFHPYKPYIDENQIVGRGVNDCKAGVAFILYLAEKIRNKTFKEENIAFLLVFKEEGAGNKSSLEIGRSFGTRLPVHFRTTILVLENTLSITNPIQLGVYITERSNFAITIDGNLEYLSDCLKRLPDWNPVAINPIEFQLTNFKLIEQPGGHVCTRPVRENVLHSVILTSNITMAISAGSEKNFAMIPTTISVQTGTHKVIHRMTITLRDIVTLEAVHEMLAPFNYVPLKDFQISQGLNHQPRIQENKLFQLLLKNKDIKAIEELNPGGSDATIIQSALAEHVKDTIHFIVAGPGCRSRKDLTPPRLTHGVNETFFIDAGLKVVMLLEKLINSIVN